MACNDHGSCDKCGFDFNGEWVYDYFLKEYDGDESSALATASMYGCKKGHGRFGKQIYVKSYDSGFKKESYYKCPECGGTQGG